MGMIGFAAIVIVALGGGFGLQYLTKKSLANEWLIVALAGAFGAYFASQSFPGSNVFSGVTSWGPEVDGLRIIPAVIGGVLLALVADLGIRTAPEPRSP